MKAHSKITHNMMSADMNMLAFIQMELSHGHFDHLIVGVSLMIMEKIVSFFFSLRKIKKDFIYIKEGNI
jgi:metal-dependent hydrolase (beta-lactamase superfamily II)